MPTFTLHGYFPEDLALEAAWLDRDVMLALLLSELPSCLTTSPEPS